MTPPVRFRPAAALLAAVAIAVGACGTAATTAPIAAPSTPAASATSQPPPSGSGPTTSGPAGSGSTTAGNWSLVPAAIAPSPRDLQTWTVDADGKFAYLFAGRTGSQVLFDLWQFDLQAGTWKLLQPKGNPKPRYGHAAAWVPGTGLVIFGGQASGGQFYNDLWAYLPDANTWTELPSNGDVPKARYGSCGGTAPDGTFWISHGFSQLGRLQDTAAYDFSAKQWKNVTTTPAPDNRTLHDCVWSTGGQFLLYGGQAAEVAALGDLWSRPVAGPWAQLANPPLPARNSAASTVMGNVMWISGGLDTNLQPLADLWSFDMSSSAWQQITSDKGPPARAGASIVADSAGHRLLLFGGRNLQADLGDLWSLALQ
jgi:hypothetical protein